MKSRVTVLMSVHNGQRYLAEAIDSILAQTYSDFEALIIDDASTDRTEEILTSYRDPRIRVLRNESNRGLTASLNRGLAEATGELVARHDADDRSHPGRLAEQVAFLDRHPSVAVVGAQANHIDADGCSRGSSRHPISADASRFALMFGTPLVHGVAMFRRAIVEELGGYDESFLTSQDVELWSRVATRGEIRNIDRVLIDFRVHGESISSTRYTEENVRKIEAVLRRSVVASTGDAELAAEWPPLWDAIVNCVVLPEVERPERAIGIVDRLRDRFSAREPQARENREIVYIYGTTQLRIALFLASRNRAATASAFGRALFAAPQMTARAFPRIAAFAVLGNRALSLREWRR